VTAEAQAFVHHALDALMEKVRGTVDRVIATESAHPDDFTDDEAEAIHDYRVALRRLRSVLRPLRALYGKAELRELSRRLKEYADATGALRDTEVLTETLSGLDVSDETREVLRRYLAHRRADETRMRRAVARMLAGHGRGRALRELSGEKLTAALRALAELVRRGPTRELSVHALALAALGRAVAEVRAFAADLEAEDVAAMHQLRIRFKRLRYTAELLAKDAGLDGELEKRAAAMQKLLGRLHDLDEARRRLQHSRSIARGARAELLVALTEARRVTARRCQEALGEHLAAIDDALERRIDPPAAPPLASVAPDAPREPDQSG
jgi:CHAD domain-containing protein